MKKILQVVGSLKTGGLEMVALSFLKYSDSTKYSFDYLVLTKEKGDIEDDIIRLKGRIFHMQSPSKDYFRYYYELVNIIKENGPYDIVHSHIYYNSAIVMMVAKRCGVPCCISHSHSIARLTDKKIANKFAHKILRIVFKKYTDKYCACSFAAGVNVFGKKEFQKKGMVITNPIDLNQFRFNPIVNYRVRKELKVNNSQSIIGCVGRIVPDKNMRFLIEIMRLYRDNNIVLLIVGDGPSRPEIENLAKQYGVYQVTRFVGMKKNVHDYLSAMDIFVLPSKHEGLGIVLIEAMANGLHCIYEQSAVVDEIKKISYGYGLNGYHASEWKLMIDKLIRKERVDNNMVKEELFNFNIDCLPRLIDNLYKG